MLKFLTDSHSALNYKELAGDTAAGVTASVITDNSGLILTILTIISRILLGWIGKKLVKKEKDAANG